MRKGLIKNFLSGKLVPFIKANWQYLIAGIIAFFIFFINLNFNAQLLTNDNYSPELNPLLSIIRSLVSPAWRYQRGLGITSDSEQADLFRSMIYLISEIFISKPLVSQLFYNICLVLGPISFGLLTSKLMIFSRRKIDSRLTFFLGFIFYLSTLWTAWVFNFPISVYVVQFGVMPLTLLSIFFFLRKTSLFRGILLLFSLGLLSATAVISTVFFVELLIIFCFAVYCYFIYVKEKKILKLVLTLSLLITTQLFWILPFSFYVTNVSKEIISDTTNRRVTVSQFEQEKEKMNATNTLSFYTTHLDIFDDNTKLQKMFVDSEKYLEDDTYKFLALIQAFFAIIGLILLVANKDYKLLFFWVVGIVAFFLIKNQNPPFGEIFKWFQDNIPLFKQALRWPTSKFGQIFLMGLSFAATYGVIALLDLASFFVEKAKYLLVAIVVVLAIGFNAFFANYLWSGNLYAKRDFVNMPNSYQRLSKYLAGDKIPGRILYLPPPNTEYFREHDWGFIGSGFFWYMANNPILDKTLTIGSSINEDAVKKIYNLYYTNSYSEFEKELVRYDVKYVVQDNSLIKGRYGTEIKTDFDYSKLSGLEKVWDEKPLALYRAKDEFVTEIKNELDAHKHDINLLSVNCDDSVIDGPYIKKECKFDGEEKKYALSANAENFAKYPVKLVFGQGAISVTPAYPEIEGLVIDHPVKKFAVTGNVNQVKFNNRLYSIQPGIPLFLYQTFESTNNIEYYTIDGYFGVASSPNFVEVSSKEKTIISLGGGKSILVKIPIFENQSKSQFEASPNNLFSAWEEFSDKTNTIKITSEGIVESIVGGFVKASKKFPTVEANSQIMFYFSGENALGVPASFCVYFSKDNKCLVEDYLTEKENWSKLSWFRGINKDDYLNVDFSSYAFTSESSNKLNGIIVQKVPDVWQSFSLRPTDGISTFAIDLEPFMIFGVSSGIYTTSLENSQSESLIAKISEKKDPGWVAFSGGRFSVVNDQKDDSNWYQSFEVKRKDVGSIYDLMSLLIGNRIIVFYWPNLLGYIGYVALILSFVLVPVYISYERKKAKK